MAKRIDVFYGGRLYTIGGRPVDEVQDEIAGYLAAGYGWLAVNDGEGIAQSTDLLVTPGVDITLAVIAGDADAADSPSPVS
ncbi:hypothetical protein [Microbacterium radiodurans]|uniref:Uncharacterized protein n=1 Tax=Microbacterium radiodurans TaxID=661398 RepID=A0A5J5IND8_9MICO|nr:hypothetical protein [Microbacterium radiodurans]KAA9084936.1 hypothetical protein F6B42_10470 [Microbacterium radiodurans]